MYFITLILVFFQYYKTDTKAFLSSLCPLFYFCGVIQPQFPNHFHSTPCFHISSATLTYSLLFSTIPIFSSHVRFLLIFAGLPITREPSGMMVFLVTRLPAPMMQSLPILAPSRIMAPIPIKVRSPIVQLWITTLWPIVTLFPMWTGRPRLTWIVQFSWMLVSSPMTIGASSPRITL